MAEVTLTQAEADALIAMAKHRVDGTEWAYRNLVGRSPFRLFLPIGENASCSTGGEGGSTSRRGPTRIEGAR